MSYLDSSQRGALALGALLLFVLVVTGIGALSIYQQLDEAARVQRALVHAQEQSYVVLRAQDAEEAGVRSYVSTRREYFLGNQLSANDAFNKSVSELELTTERLNLTALTAVVRDMAAVHRQWERTVARPLVDYPLPRNAQQIERTGKILADRIRADAGTIEAMLNAEIAGAQSTLVWRINETLGIALIAILLFGVLGIVFVGARRRMLARLERERRITETLQRAFRTDWDALPRSRIGTAYVSATRDANVGGDLFDIHRLDDDLSLLIVADVSGKGIEAAVNTAFVKYSIRTIALSERNPGAILRAFNALFLDSIKDPSLFVSAFVGIFDAKTLRLTYGSAGHSGAYLRRGGDVSQLDVTGPLIGLDRSFSYDSATLALVPHDLLVLATDGLTEARDRQGDTIDDAGVMRLVRESSVDPQECADGLVSEVRRRGGGRIFDDLALLVVAIDAVEERGTERSTEAAA